MPTAEEINSPKFCQPSLTADFVAFVRLSPEDIESFKGWHDEYPDSRGPDPTEPGWHVLLIGRQNPPYPHNEGYYCTPGGFVDYGEDPNDAAPRELAEETHLNPHSLPKMKLVGVYGKRKRDPRRHVVTIAYSCILTAEQARAAYGGDDAKWTEWVHLSRALSRDFKFGFDHRNIVRDAVAQIT